MSKSKLLIIPQNWLGDIVMSQTLLKKIKFENPDTSIDILVNSQFKGLVKRMPEVNKPIILDCGHKELNFFKRLNLAKKIKGNYDRSIILSRSMKSALIPYLAKIPIRTGELGESRYIIINDLKKFNKDDRRNTALRYVSMFSKKEETLDEKYFPSLQSDSKNIKILFEKYKLNFEKKIIIFAPGAAFGPSKMWPVEKFRELGKKLNEEELIDLIGDYDVLIAGTEPITRKVLNSATSLKLISRVGIGLDNIDLVFVDEARCIRPESLEIQNLETCIKSVASVKDVLPHKLIIFLFVRI